MKHAKFFADILAHKAKELPFVVYSKPEDDNRLTAILQQDTNLYLESDYGKSGFVFSAFNNQRASIFFPLEKSVILVLENLSRATPKSSSISEPIISSSVEDPLADSSDEREQHIKLVNIGIERLKAGEMEKVVLSRKEVVDLGERDPLMLFQELLKNYPSAFVYCWFHPKVGLWFGATPESLLQVDGLTYKTMALAGTQKFAGNMDVEWGTKEKQEQQFVTDSIVGSLQDLKMVETIKVTAPFTSKAANLLHIRTDISGKLRSAGNLEEIILSLHPTPAVCGLPKEKAKNFIIKEEGYAREFYTGFLGELNFPETKNRSRNRRNTENLAYASVRKKTSLYVNLRCMKLQNNKAEIFVGGGITKDSVPEDEWQETVNKAQTMKKVISK